MNKAILLLLILTALSLPLRAQAALTTIDGFKIYSSGSVTISGAGIKAVAVQPWDRKIIIGGSFTATGVGSTETRSNLARLNFDGTLDTGFTAVADGPVHAVVIQLHQEHPEVPENNAILVGGSFTKITATRTGIPEPAELQRRGVARLGTAEGFPDDFDPGTGTDGTVVSAIAVDAVSGDIALGGLFTEMAHSWCSNIAVVSSSGAFRYDLSGGVAGGGVAAIVWQEGRMFVGGSFLLPRPHLARFLFDGALDPGFVPTPSGAVRALALQPDGSLLIGGDFTSLATTNFPAGKERLHLARVDGDGLLDDFDPGAVGADGYVAAVVMDPEGRILIGGSFESVPHPAGRPVEGETALPRRGAARLTLSGAVDATADPAPDAAVNAIALQPDGKFIIAGGFAGVKGGRTPRTRLARFYPYGELDDDVFPIGQHFRDRLNQIQSDALSHQDDGHLILSTTGEKIDGSESCRMLRLNPDWTVTDFATACPIPLAGSPLDVSPKLDGSPIIGGPFIPVLDGMRYTHAVQTTKEFFADPTAAFNKNLRIPDMGGLLCSFISSIVHAPDGAIYLGGSLYKPEDACLPYECPPEYNVRKVLPDGTPDPNFILPLIDGPVLSMAVQEDPVYGHKLVVGSVYSVSRFLPNGKPDPDFQTYIPRMGFYGTYTWQITPLPNGQISLNGYIAEGLSEGGIFWERHVVRLNNDGKLDDSYRVDTSSPVRAVKIYRTQYQADGKIIVTGNFDSVRGPSGPSVTRHGIARFDFNGKPDDLDLGEVDVFQYREIDVSLLLPDGKLVVAGAFLHINGDTKRAHLARFAVGSATETMTVSPDGQQVTWLRGGAAPEAHQVVFEQSPDGSEGSWQTMGRGHRVPGGWRIDYDLAQHGWSRNRYVRASAYLTGTAGGGYLHRSVLLYYLRPLLKVQPRPESREYGGDNPVLRWDYVNEDGSHFQPLSLSGAPRLDTTAAKLSPVGTYPISVSVDKLSSWRYRFSRGAADVTVTPKEIKVVATPQSKRVGELDPSPLPYTWSPELLPGDSFSGSLSRSGDETQGQHPIEVGSLALDGNYRIKFTGSQLTIFPVAGKSAQKITFPAGEKTFGASDFELWATANSGLPVSYSTKIPGPAQLLGTKVRVHSPGLVRTGTTFLASQPGDLFYDRAVDTVGTVWVNPPPGNALYFDGVDDLLQVPDKPQLRFDAKPGFTVEAWIFVDGSQPDGSAIVSKGNPGVRWRGFQLLLNQNSLAAELGDGDSMVGIGAGLMAGYPLNDRHWHHVALTYDRASATATLYLDGRVEGQAATPLLGGSLDSTEPLLLGVDRGLSRYLHGKIDELRIWDIARSRSDIRSAAGFILDPPSEPRLMAYYHFDEGAEFGDNRRFTRAPERTANGVNGNDGILSGYTLLEDESNWVASDALAPLVDTTSFSWNGTSATGGGIVYPNYFPITDRGVCWGLAPHPGRTDLCLRFESGEGVFQAKIDDLGEYGDTYYFRAFASNSVGSTSYGDDMVLHRGGGGKEDQAISFELPAKTYGDPDFPLVATATSGLPVTFESLNQSIAVVENGRVRIVGAGEAVIIARQAGDAGHNPASASRTLSVARAPLTVSADYKARVFLAPNPPLTVSYRGFVKGEGSSVISGSPLLSTTATQESPVGDYDILVDVAPLTARNYKLTGAKGVLSVVKSCQQIIFPRIGDKTYGDPPFELIAYSCSGLPIGFASSDPAVARLQGNLVSITAAGSAVITASQPGSGNTEQAPDVAQTLLVHRGRQELEFPELARRVLGDPPVTLSATASSGLPVRYRSSDPAVAEVAGNLAAIVGPGTAVITASQEGDANYNPALPVSRPLVVAAEGIAPNLSLSTLASGSVTSNPVLNVTGSATDASGIASLTVNDRDLTSQAELFSAALPLRSGENSVKLTATDGAGNRESREIEVLFDAAAPLLRVDAPADNSVTDSALFELAGSAGKGSSVALAVNGGGRQTAQLSGESFSASGYLQEGVNTVEVTAELSGRSATLKRSVTLSYGKPYLAITEPPQDIRTEQETLTLAGMAGAKGGEATLALEVDGASVPVTLQGGAFRKEIALHEGENRIRARATDGSGNTSAAQRNVIRYTRVPGDLNGDGLVDIRDVLTALRMSLGIEPVTDAALQHGDVAPLVNGASQPDGRIDVGDVLLLLRKVVGLADF
jgi:uncharacterized delta-60 repeat protein